MNFQDFFYHLSEGVRANQPVANVHLTPKKIFFAWGGRGKSGHAFGPIGFSHGRPLP